MSGVAGRHRLRASALVVAAVVALTAGCGIRTDDEPRAMSADSVPFDLLAPSTTSTTATTAPERTSQVPIYLVDRNGLLVEVTRKVPMPVEIRAVLAELLEGATDREAERGLRSAITGGTELIGVQLDLQTGVVALNLTGDITSVQGEALQLALAQVVYTATALRTVNGVLFEFDGEPTDVPDGEGALESTPLGRRDYTRFDPEVAATSTTTAPPPEG